jgi:hypothetical protein
MQFHLSILALISWAIKSPIQKFIANSYIFKCFCYVFPVVSLKLQVLHWGFLKIHFELILVRVRDRDLILVFNIGNIKFPQHCLLKKLFFSKIPFWWKADNCNWMGLFWGILFYSIGLHVCFCTSTMLFLLPGLCNIIWSDVLWYLKHCSFYSGLLWPFKVFSASL